MKFSFCFWSSRFISDPFIIPNPDGEHITQFTWNQDYNILALGAKSGTIFFYSPDFQLLHTIYHQQKAVQCLEWHPEAFVEGSTYFAWLASATNDNSFVIYNCSCLINSGTFVFLILVKKGLQKFSVLQMEVVTKK